MNQIIKWVFGIASAWIVVTQAAEVVCVADGATGEYCGTGYAISVNVSAPASGATVKYAESADGPWLDTLACTNVCTDKPIYYQVTATGYATKTGSANVTVRPKTLTNDTIWLVLPTEDYVYDGTAKEPEAAFGDGDPSILTAADFEVAYSDNVNAGTATATFTGKGNYTGSCTEEFEIRKAVLGGGSEPGGGVPPTGGLSRWDVAVEYDGQEHTLDTNGLLVAIADLGSTYTPAANFMVQYALGTTDVEPTDGWAEVAPSFVNAGTNVVWYKATAANFDDYTHAVQIEITPRDLSHVSVAGIDDQPETGAAIEPGVSVSDGSPSLVTEDDYGIAYSNNVAPGTATVTLTGTRNYTGVKRATFTIVAQTSCAAELAANISWTYLKASGTYFAQIRVTCTNGFSAGITNLRYLFADRGTDVRLWDTTHRAARANTVTYNGAVYRYVDLDASRITAEGTEVVYGVSDPGVTVIPVAERTIEMYVAKRILPQTGNESSAGVGDFVGFLGWTTDGVEKVVPLVAEASPFRAALNSAPKMAMPLAVNQLNRSLAVGAVVTEDSSPYVRLVAFAIKGTAITGTVEVGAGSARGALGANAVVSLLGAETLSEDFAVVSTIKADAKGNFAVENPKGYSFFKIKLSVEEVLK